MLSSENEDIIIITTGTNTILFFFNDSVEKITRPFRYTFKLFRINTKNVKTVPYIHLFLTYMLLCNEEPDVRLSVFSLIRKTAGAEGRTSGLGLYGV